MAVTDQQLVDMLEGLSGLPDGPWFPTMEDAFDPDDGSHDGTFCEGVYYVTEEIMQDRDGNVTGFEKYPEDLDIRNEMVARHVARLNPDTVREMVEELQAFRAAAEPGTPPDFQEWGHACADDSVNLNTAMVTRDQLAAKGCTWFRVQKLGTIIYLDGWKVRPDEMAPFVVFPGNEWKGDQP